MKLARSQNTNKYDYGHVLVIGGSQGMVGAPFLSAMAAMRIGAGMVTIASTKPVIEKLEKRVVEVMTLRLPKNQQKQLTEILNFVRKRKVNVIAIGPGMDPKFSSITNDLIKEIKIPIVIDASAIYSLKEIIANKYFENEVIITPHDGEFKKLTEIELPDNISEREAIFSKYAKKHNIEIIGKGSPTITTDKNGKSEINQSGNPGLATAGSGDVLTGIVAGLLAQGEKTHEAAKLGVYMHGLAADLAAEEKTQPGMIASDIIEYLPLALKSLNKKSAPKGA